MLYIHISLQFIQQILQHSLSSIKISQQLLCLYKLIAQDTESLVTGCDCPLMRIAPSDTVTITVPGDLITTTADVYAAFLISKKEPIPSVVEN